MTARYVQPATGTDSGAGGIGAPWKTLTYAVANCTTGDTIELLADSDKIEANWTFTSATANNKTVSIYSTPGHKYTVCMSDTTRGVLITGVGWANTSSYTISDMTLCMGNSASNGIIETLGTGAGAITFAFSNVTIETVDGVYSGGAGDISRCWYDNHGVTTLNWSYSFTNCTFNGANIVAGTTLVDAAKPFDSVTFSGCTFNNGNATCINMGQSSGAGGHGVNAITITGCTFNCTLMDAGKSAFFWNYTNTEGCSRMTITNNTVNTSHIAWDVEGCVSALFVAGNTITGSSQNVLMLIGPDGLPGIVAGITYATVIGNALSLTGTASHGHFMGRSIVKGEYAYNTANNCDYGMVIKGNAAIHAHHNTSTNVKNGCIYLRGSTDCYIENNSFYRIGNGHVSECFGISTDSIQDAGPAYIDPARNVFKRNLIYIADGAPTSGAYGVWENDASHAGVTSIADNVYDYNIMRLPSGMNWANFNGGTTYATVALARTAWQSYGTVNKLNEVNDQATDPKFYSATDLRLKPDSPAIGSDSNLNNPYGAQGGAGGSGTQVKMGISI